MSHSPYAAAFAEPAGSPIRELFPYLSRPGMISFAGGYPSPTLLDGAGIEQAAQRVFAQGAGILQYGATEGAPALREALARLCDARGIEAKPEDILVTTGSQQAFDLLVRVFVEPGDVVYVESPSYPATLQALRLAGARIEQVPVDDQGMRIDVLESLLANAPADALPKLIYTVPTYSNPCGTLLSQERRAQLASLAARHGVIVVEDDPYGELRFSPTAVEPIHALGARLPSANPVIYLSSLSKTLAPALRVGWMVAPAEVIRRCAIAKQTTDLCTSPIAQLIAAEYLNAGRYPDTVERARREYGARMQAMVDMLQAELGGRIRANPPEGGMFIWAEAQDDLAPGALFQACVDQGVLFVPGAAFYAANPKAGTMRLSYAAPNVDQIREGVRRLAAAYNSALSAGK
ncbi:PLP-dependent aminotransferase family protein [Achromobacter sp. Marseille-Q0513]|uniref:aminotransferase-like domain-containing protein n=1 Tax=Achromobacter sp. Marseille-Q0513 TaxID=2829161 RepID=UPI001B922195|nr:PLP-dependent aminotransferase family protein [Achromobacter sp. Marseille-Q0513]MBR8655345.1 PLP-dependent aminotransferase family protein [Achromobacter sp. Marseille-Q0513]